MFRFTIRDVLWLMVVVGLALGWWVDHRSLAPDAELQRGQSERLKAYSEMVKSGRWPSAGEKPN